MSRSREVMHLADADEIEAFIRSHTGEDSLSAGAKLLGGLAVLTAGGLGLAWWATKAQAPPAASARTSSAKTAGGPGQAGLCALDLSQVDDNYLVQFLTQAQREALRAAKAAGKSALDAVTTAGVTVNQLVAAIKDPVGAIDLSMVDDARLNQLMTTAQRDAAVAAKADPSHTALSVVRAAGVTVSQLLSAVGCSPSKTASGTGRVMPHVIPHAVPHAVPHAMPHVVSHVATSAGGLLQEDDYHRGFNAGYHLGHAQPAFHFHQPVGQSAEYVAGWLKGMQSAQRRG